MTTLTQYVNNLKNKQELIARQLGADISYMDKQSRVERTATLALLAVVVKTLVDKGLVTDAEFNQTFNDALLEAWPNLPNQTTPPDPAP